MTGIGAGFLGAELNCLTPVSWSVEPGVVLFGFTRPEAYVRGTLGLSYPQPRDSGRAANEHTMRVRASLSYALIRSQSFQGLADAQPTPWFTSPGLQQWALLLNTKISSELLIPATTPQSFFNSCGFELWQTLPRQWRGLGAIKYTKNAQASGMLLKGYRSVGPWSLSAGLGLTSVALSETVFSFVHPTMDVMYRLEDRR